MILKDVNGVVFEYDVVRLDKSDLVKYLEQQFPSLKVSQYYGSPTDTVVIIHGKGWHINLLFEEGKDAVMHVCRMPKERFATNNKMCMRLYELINK